ncbi:type II secretion system F family protein [Leptolyngbya sp. FACHB-261]|uniref:type II secretion system F family protein n=1 Tax=Leptolyngbya sp. FACHB-261 TaxID=2692806 RepID=UPI0016880780|nr:type II secretion system F family protein [Leptolyngbya sp. FACHB-261]MBD2105116.1 type II secretion system F family protein [Leptolyngbya sp. FACHB-261]
MPTYVARARDSQGNSTKQRVVAESASEARSVLRERGLYVLDLKQAQAFDPSTFDLAQIGTAMAKITVKDKAVFSRQFAALVNAGVSMVRGLGVLAEQCENPKLKGCLVEIRSDVEQGSNLSDSMRKHPEAFDGLYCSMVQAGEVGGVLDEVLNRLSKLLEDQARLQNQIKSAMAYPTTVGTLAVLIFIGMVVFILPTFAGVFKQLGGELPAFTQFMMNISVFLRTPQYSVGLILVLFGLSIVYRRYYNTRVGRETIDRLTLKLPLFGDLIQKTAVARFCRTFGALSGAGVPILTALEIVRDTSGNQVIANAIDEARRSIKEGGMISLAIQKEQVFPVMAVQMINIGEETGELDKMLLKVADFYDDEIEQTVKALTSIMEPIMIAVLGGMVGSILVAMYLPMFKIFDLMG